MGILAVSASQNVILIFHVKHLHTHAHHTHARMYTGTRTRSRAHTHTYTHTRKKKKKNEEWSPYFPPKAKHHINMSELH